jgi:hypothetical protein
MQPGEIEGVGDVVTEDDESFWGEMFACDLSCEGFQIIGAVFQEGVGRVEEDDIGA